MCISKEKNHPQGNQSNVHVFSTRTENIPGVPKILLPQNLSHSYVSAGGPETSVTQTRAAHLSAINLLVHSGAKGSNAGTKMGAGILACATTPG